MTTTSTFSGMNEEAKPSSRVLRPPGGGSSNIFGTPDPTPAASARTTGKPADSGIFDASSDAASKGSAQRSARDGDDSFNRLFGDKASSPAVSQKGTSASQRVDTHANLFGDVPESPQEKTPAKSQSTHENLFGEPVASARGDRAAGRYAGRGRGSYNPITGSDYKDLAPNHHALHVKEAPKPQKEQPPLPCSDGEYQAREGKMQNVQTSTRVTNPPGGKTHKLW
ncbi:uncharacterized protein LOC143283994 isoform X1 [Babylonia areolata]|uniref:uncharacterized protein LOC143283994 isoform X1 n=1 Tax=Babylonia areolata TaxID=304850 RepID=UPI003FD5CC24